MQTFKDEMIQDSYTTLQNIKQHELYYSHSHSRNKHTHTHSNNNNTNNNRPNLKLL